MPNRRLLRASSKHIQAMRCQPNGIALAVPAVSGGKAGSKDHLIRWLAVANRHAYIQNHGYSLYVNHEPLSQRHAAWHKVLLADIAFQHSCAEYVWVLDSDAYIMNMSQSVETVLHDVFARPPDLRPDVVVAKDCNGINSGSIFFRNTPWTRQHLADIWATDKVRCFTGIQCARCNLVYTLAFPSHCIVSDSLNQRS